MTKSKSLTLKELEAKIDANTGCLDLSLLKLTDISFLKKLKGSKFIRKIKSIDLSDNKLIFEESNHENTFTINNEKILEICPIPEVIRNQIDFINLSNNHCERVPSYFGLLKNLKKLDLYCNNLTNLNLDVFGSTLKLNWLDVSGNENLDDEGKNLISKSNDHYETASNVVNFYSEKFEKASKMREKRKKKQDKQNEKAAKELKFKLKEERRQAYQDKIKKEAEEAEAAALAGGSSVSSSENEQDDNDNTVSKSFLKNGSEKFTLEASSSSFWGFKNAILAVFKLIFSGIFSVVNLIFTVILWLILTFIIFPVKLLWAVTVFTIKYSLLLGFAVAVSLLLMYFTCQFIPEDQVVFNDYGAEVCQKIDLVVGQILKAIPF